MGIRDWLKKISQILIFSQTTTSQDKPQRLMQRAHFSQSTDDNGCLLTAAKNYFHCGWLGCSARGGWLAIPLSLCNKDRERRTTEHRGTNRPMAALPKPSYFAEHFILPIISLELTNQSCLNFAKNNLFT